MKFSGSNPDPATMELQCRNSFNFLSNYEYYQVRNEKLQVKIKTVFE